MKKVNLRVYTLFLSVIFAVSTVFAAMPEKTITIKTSARCGMCKQKIEKAVTDVNGVKSATLDLTSKTVKVKYDDAVTNVDEIRNAIAAIGYTADGVKPTKEAYDNLPGCCKGEPDGKQKNMNDKKHKKSNECTHEQKAKNPECKNKQN
jgi:periplasmic mercuric ion binding protein